MHDILFWETWILNFYFLVDGVIDFVQTAQTTSCSYDTPMGEEHLEGNTQKMMLITIYKGDGFFSFPHFLYYYLLNLTIYKIIINYAL